VIVNVDRLLRNRSVHSPLSPLLPTRLRAHSLLLWCGPPSSVGPRARFCGNGTVVGRDFPVPQLRRGP
jgi:hypothetical protein